MVAVGGAVTEVDDGKVERRPLLTPAGILMMNLGFFGIQFSFGLTQTAINPLFSLIGADAHSLPILNLAGPVTGLLIQPLIGAISDRTWSPRFGKRKPFVLAGALACVVILFLFPYVSAVWMAVVGLWLLDAGNNTAMEPYRALITDRLPKSQLARGFLTQSLFTGAGAVLANLSLFVFQQIISGATAAGVPYWAFACFWLGAVCILVTVLIAMARTKELPPTEEELAELRAQPKGLHHAIGDLVTAVKVMPVPMHKIGFVFLFQWYAMFIYWQFVALSIGESVFNTKSGPTRLRRSRRLERLGERCVQLLHHDQCPVPDPILPELWRQAGARSLSGPGRGVPGRSGEYQQQIHDSHPDDRLRHLLGQHGRGALPDGREHGSQGTQRRGTWVS